jgi:ADP-heptose:LPS heptosyltransferase
LQKGPEASEPPPSGIQFRNSLPLGDFCDTAGLIANLDLVISVDTSIVHLAGALARPVWTLLPIRPDFRWLRDRNDSPWYPTMRLFRQTTHGQWEDVVQKVADELRKLSLAKS